MNALGAHLKLYSEDQALSFLTDEQLYAELASIPEQFKELETWRMKLLGIVEKRKLNLRHAEKLAYGYERPGGTEG